MASGPTGQGRGIHHYRTLSTCRPRYNSTSSNTIIELRGTAPSPLETDRRRNEWPPAWSIVCVRPGIRQHPH